MDDPPDADALLGRRVVITRAATQSAELVGRLEALGAVVVQVPVIAIAEPDDGGVAINHAVEHLHTYDWVVLTSPNAAARFLSRTGGRVLPRLAVVGPGTSTAVVRAGASVALSPARNIGEGLVDIFDQGPGRVLLPRAASARDAVPHGLRQRGWHVDVVAMYRTVHIRPSAELLVESAAADAIVFTSSSTVDAYFAVAAPTAVPAVIVSIGPATSATLLALGLAVTVTADPHTLDGVVEAVVRTLAGGGRSTVVG